MRIKIGTIEFRTKKAATEYVSGLLDKYPLGHIVDADDDHEFLIALLSRHPAQQEKEGSGVAYFSRHQHPEYKTAYFMLHRLDGSHTDFATKQCIDAKGPSLIAEFREACRQAVDSRVHGRKKEIYDTNSGTVTCPETGEPLEKGEYWLVQIDPSPAEMVDEFIRINALRPSKSDLIDAADNRYWAEFADAGLARKFSDFHATLMNLVPKRVGT